jgi:hypothetical protein
MARRGPKTVAEARALPEVESAWFETERHMTPGGITVITQTPRKFSARGIEGDDILWFTDSDGRSMQVIDTEDGPAKAPFGL